MQKLRELIVSPDRQKREDAASCLQAEYPGLV
jgi:hypothetical protein